MYFRVLVFVVLVAGVFGKGLPLQVHENVKVSNLDKIPRDISWMTGKSRLVNVGFEGISFNNISNDDPAAAVCTAKFSCSGCNEAQICQPDGKGAFTLLKKVTCPVDLPFCDFATGTCTSIPDASCGQTDAFICMDDGHFPDTLTSSNYHVCQKGVSHTFECVVEGEQYDAGSQMCVKIASYPTFNCLEKGRIVPHNVDKSYYAYCNVDSKGAAVPYVVERCSGSYTFNVTGQQCEIICQSEGVFEDVSDCTKYYRCNKFWVDEKTWYYVKESKTCPDKTSFSLNERMCIDAATNTDCANKK